MTGSTAPKSDKESANALLVPVQGPRCELLFEAFQGELGSVHLGRMLSGTDAGRVVALRELAERPSAELTLATERARGLVSPRLQKTLGVLRVDGTWFLASEYISGVALSELSHALVKRDERLELSVALRITLDMLNAAIAAREQLSSLGAAPVRCLHPESVWLADFGETFLSEVLTSAILVELTGMDIPSSLGTTESQDAREAGLRLLELSTGSTAPSSLEDPRLPTRVREIAARATGRHGAARYTTLQAFADAIGELDPSLVGSEEDVSLELRRLLGPMLETRRQKLTMSERGALHAGNADETKFFRAESRPMQRETARPPSSDAQTGSDHSEEHPSVAPALPSDPPTMIFRRPVPSDDDFRDVTEASRRDAGALASAPPSSPTRVSAELTQRDSLPAVARPRVFGARQVLVLCVLLLALIAFGATSGPDGALRASLRWIRHVFGAISG